MKRLQLRFKTAEGKAKSFVLNYVKADLDDNTVKEAMEKISTSKIFEKDTVGLFETIVGAKYVERIETKVF